MLNGHNNEYIILFGHAMLYPESYVKSCRHRYSSKTEAVKYAKYFTNAYVFKLHYKAGDDLPLITLVY